MLNYLLSGLKPGGTPNLVLTPSNSSTPTRSKQPCSPFHQSTPSRSLQASNASALLRTPLSGYIFFIFLGNYIWSESEFNEFEPHWIQFSIKPTIFEPCLKFKPRLKLFKFGLRLGMLLLLLPINLQSKLK